MPSEERTTAGLLGAWMVHLFTASGAIFGLLSVQAASEGHYTASLAWMMVTAAIDAVDGGLARRLKVKVVLPHFDGALLDNMVDYFTFVLVPAYFLLCTEIVPEAWRMPLACAMILTSAYQFSRDDAKTADHTFTGFPSYWNVAVFYLFLLDWPRMVNVTLLVICAVAVFVRVQYLYPSRTRFLRPLNLGLGVLWAAMCIVAFVRYPDGHRLLLTLSLFYLVYYVAISLWLTARKAGAPRTLETLPGGQPAP